VTDFMLDTAFFIDLRSQRHQGAAQAWGEIAAGNSSAAISPIAIYELWVGSRMDRDEEAFYRACFLLLEEAPLPGTVAMQAGTWMRSERDRPEWLFRDALIAASALERDEAVLTRNVRDFARFPGVRVESY
jgi:tRNA(fMet)-specific endonuclease VapC